LTLPYVTGDHGALADDDAVIGGNLAIEVTIDSPWSLEFQLSPRCGEPSGKCHSSVGFRPSPIFFLFLKIVTVDATDGVAQGPGLNPSG
jgi:hypothetical protein